ncbi:hypothetical protein PIB30_003601 [Stylosanthes scabra]|uniref:DUF4220 domain-containing protein n=1 Tax=Stylosanthes scabra TaxID=79078 RepID=A0ABU6Y2W0_9FABA|nr:hypothetical protein [Stylosanthes scabra]
MHLFSASWQQNWENWQIRVKVLSSLTLQTILIFLGNKRKISTNIPLRFIIWVCYMYADWLATISLGVISSKVAQQSGDVATPKQVVMALWAPLLLLHLGGPDTITAYSMEDNQLWLRKLNTFGFQVFLAIYIFIRAWTAPNTALNVLAIPILFSGSVKIGERIWCLRSASYQCFKESLFPEPDPGPNYARYMEAYMAGSQEGFIVKVESLIDSPFLADNQTHPAAAEGNVIPLPETDLCGGDQVVTNADKFLKTFKRLFADLILTVHDVLESRLSLQNAKSEQVFRVMEVELGFMYDLFYTKAKVVYSAIGAFLRFLTFSCSVVVLCVFYAMDKSPYPKAELIITYVLLHGSVFLEWYSAFSLLFSDWTKLWMSKHKNRVTSVLVWAVSKLRCGENKRWSGRIGQFNLVSFCLKAKRERCSFLHKISRHKFCFRFTNALKKGVAKCCVAQMIRCVYQDFKKFMHDDSEIVDNDLKDIIFKHFKTEIEGKTKEIKDEMKVANEIKTFCNHRGRKVLENLQLGWSVEKEFDKSVLLWHIATDICYISDTSGDANASGEGEPNYRRASKLLSDYMLHLLVMSPFMLPNGIGEIRFQDTCAEAIEFFKERKSIKNKNKACKKLLKICKESKKVPPSEVKGDKSKSVLFEGCMLAARIRELREKKDWKESEMWKVISEVWVEMVGYAACHCKGIHHAQQLRRGGELLTHVWLLMAHLGITDQFQISEGHVRKKLGWQFSATGRIPIGIYSPWADMGSLFPVGSGYRYPFSKWGEWRGQLQAFSIVLSIN